jgi:hypothetical protein
MGTVASPAPAAQAGLAASLHYSGQGRSPAGRIGLRAIDPERYVIFDVSTSRVLEEVEANKVGAQGGGQRGVRTITIRMSTGLRVIEGVAPLGSVESACALVVYGLM